MAITKSASTSKNAASSSSSSSSESDSEETSSDSGSDTTSASDSDSDSEFGEVTKEYLDSLLEKAEANLRAKAQVKGKGKQRAFGEEEEEIRLDDEPEEEDVSLKRLPQLDPGILPPGYFDFKDGNPKEVPTLRDIDAELLAASASSSTPAAPPEPPEVGKDGRKLTKKELKALKKKNAAPGWSDLPTPDAADLPRLYREVEALRLRNALDPKRFYRKESGEGKGIKGLPERFAIGTIVTTKTPFGTTSGENLARSERKRTLVDELVADSEAKRYAKRKFGDLQTVRAARGRGTLAKRAAARRPKW
ncbi:Fcf2-domain-containing protein [Fomitiporia mediterranea MF3/22]|uniref:Fcf2-domain-containing protein n=1 Tax=Fomitiporia mediterranea (strain MF3/22) TaxID=694068 RepID=UPI0004407672|nr:Fcf2-domain-containing protein [Fomitiporia mediterranea MF3/22]EJC98872.1 Fcf2-domain-containing protein [Fomitiporia mediterranea MF3/22]